MRDRKADVSATRRGAYAFAPVLACAALLFACTAAADPLESWNDLEAKQAIIRFVRDATTPETTTFVAPGERIAVFDNDGTLWVEQPIYIQFAFALDRAKALAPLHPEW
jgi:hypothetical protein